MVTRSTLAGLVNGRRAGSLIAAFVFVTLAWFRFGPAQRLTQTDVPLLDTQTGYPPEHAYAQLDLYGELGRSQYVLFLLGDFVWILFFGVTVAAVFLVATRRYARGDTRWNWVVLVPAAVVLLDWLENASLLAMTLRFPERMDSLAAAAPVFTTAKTIFANISLTLFVVAVLAIAVSYALRLRRAAA